MLVRTVLRNKFRSCGGKGSNTEPRVVWVGSELSHCDRIRGAAERGEHCEKHALLSLGQPRINLHQAGVS